MTFIPEPPVLTDFWAAEDAAKAAAAAEMSLYTVRCYNYSGFDVAFELTNVRAASEAAAKEIMQLRYRLGQSRMECTYAFKQPGRM